MATVEVTVNALNVRSGPGTNYGAASALLRGQDATVDSFAYGAWLHVTAPHAGYLYSGSQAAPNVRLLDVIVTPPPTPSGDTMKVKTTDAVNVRPTPGTSGAPVTVLPAGTEVTVYAHITQQANGLTWYQIASPTQQWIAAMYTVKVNDGPSSPPTPLPPPVPPVGTWTPPLNAALYGGHGNPGGWRPNAAELDVYHRNGINYALIPAYQPNQQGAIADLQSAGVQHFIIRACIGGAWDTAANFAKVTVPILEQYAAALGGPNNMMILLGNEPNLVAEGWTHAWQSGSDFAIWWLNVASIYRSNLPGCKLGFAAMSPGGDVSGVRMDERSFVAGCHAAIQSADWIATHCYWDKPDGSDLTVPLSMWRSQFGSKPIVVTETGPANVTVTTQAIQHAHLMYSTAGLPATFWIVDGSGSFTNASWKDHSITVNPSIPPEPAPQSAPVPTQAGKLSTSYLGLYLWGETTWQMDAIKRLADVGRPMPFAMVMRNGDPKEITPTSIKLISPQTVVGERWFYEPEGIDWEQADGYDAGVHLVRNYVARFAIDRRADFHYVINEPMPGVATPRVWQGALDEAKRQDIKLFVFNFPETWAALPGDLDEHGQPKLHRDFWTWPAVHDLVSRVIAERHALSWHTYIIPDPDGKWDHGYSMGREDEIIACLPPALRNVLIYQTEGGTGWSQHFDGDVLVNGFRAWDTWLHTTKANVGGAAPWVAANWVDNAHPKVSSDLAFHKDKLLPYWMNASF